MHYLTANQVRQRYGGISDMTLWRWMHDARVGFPRPVVIQRRRYWPEHDIQDFDRRRGAEGEAHQTRQAVQTAVAA